MQRKTNSSNKHLHVRIIRRREKQTRFNDEHKLRIIEKLPGNISSSSLHNWVRSDNLLRNKLWTNIAKYFPENSEDPFIALKLFSFKYRFPELATISTDKMENLREENLCAKLSFPSSATFSLSLVRNQHSQRYQTRGAFQIKCLQSTSPLIRI